MLTLQAWIASYYLWIKAFHMFAIVAWMAGLFYLPRLFVYHSGVEPTSEAARLFIIMEYRLYKIIMVPSMLLSLASGLLLVIVVDAWASKWFYVKLVCVISLITLQHLLSCWRKQLAQGKCTHTAYFFRIINEVPPLLVIVVIISVIVKPF